MKSRISHFFLFILLTGLFLIPAFAARDIRGNQAKVVTNQNSKSVGTRIVFLNPSSTKDSWWNNCTLFMLAAAKHFGMHLEVLYANAFPGTMLQQAKSVIESPNPPDFIVLQNLKRSAPIIIKMADARHVKVILFNSGLSDNEALRIGAPRERVENWLGQIIPDDAQAGYDLAQALVTTAKSRNMLNPAGKVEVLALGGMESDQAAVERNNGLLKYLSDHPHDATLNRQHIFSSNWQPKLARDIYKNASKMFPDTAVVWTANDMLAMGVLQSAKENFGNDVGKKVLIGGIDWNSENIQSIKTGEITVSIGGHFADGAWLMVLINDYVNGIDFANEGLTIKTRLGIINRSNVDKYLRTLSKYDTEKINRIDFSKFSKYTNPKLKRYHFSAEALVDEIK